MPTGIPFLIPLFLICVICALASSSHAQNIPPPGAYQPIPNFSGTGAGLLFRKAINDRFSGAQPISPIIVRLAFAQLPPEGDGAIIYCTDCQKAAVCAAGGSGTWAFGQNGQWSCAAGSAGLSASYSGPLSLTGNQSNGGDAISHVNLNGIENIQDFGATCSNTTATATTVSGNVNVTVNSIGDFVVGQYVHIDHAGASSALSTPTLTSVTKYTYGFNPPPLPVAHNGYDGSGCTTDSTASTFSNATCTTSYSYAIVNVAENGSWSAPSAVVTTTNGAATLSTDNYNRLVWTTDPNAAGTIIYGCHGASCTPAVIAVLPRFPVGGTTGVTQYYDDMGNHFGSDEDFGTTMQSGAVAADDNTYITAISGTTVTLNTAPVQTGAFTMRHDSAPAVQAALTAACPLSGTLASTCGTVFAPQCNGYYELGGPVSFYGMREPKVVGASDNPGASQFQWDGPTGGIVWNLNSSVYGHIEDIGFPDYTGNTPGVVYSADNYSTSVGPGGNPGGRGAGHGLPLTHWYFAHDEVGQAGVAVTLDSNGSIGNVEDFSFEDFNCDAPNHGGFACVYGNSTQTDNTRWNGGLIGQRDYAFKGIFGGLAISHIDSQNLIDLAVGGYQNSQFSYSDSQMGSNMLCDGCLQAVGTGGTGLYRFSNLKDDGPSPGPAGYIFYGGGFFFENDLGTVTANTSSNLAIWGPLVSIGNLYSTGTSNANSGGAYPSNPGGLPFTDSSGGQSTHAFVSIGDSVNGVGPTPLVFSGGTGTDSSVSLKNLSLTTVADNAPAAVHPTVGTNCGTSPSGSVGQTGDNTAFTITVGGTASVTSCGVTFAAHPAFGNAPICTPTDITKGISLTQTSLTTAGVTLGAPSGVSDLHGDTINVTCIGK